MRKRQDALKFFSAAALSTLVITPVAAEIPWTEAHPLRRDALVEGRDFHYNSESFLHRFSYRHLSDKPEPGRDGIRGTGGSISSDSLYIDYYLQKTFAFDDQRHAFVARMQRGEDFDGHFERQLVGVSRQVSQNWRAAFLSDVTGNKADADVQLEAQWQHQQTHTLRLAVVLTDPMFNDKNGTGGEYRQSPVTYFAHYRHHPEQGSRGEIAVNFSPKASFEDRLASVIASGDQLRLMAAFSTPVGDRWRTGLRFKGERSERSFRFQRDEPPAADSFSRRMYSLSWHITATDLPAQPHVGLRHYRLHERGWFGEALASSGRNLRDGTAVFAGLTFNTGERQSWQPNVTISKITYDRNFVEDPSVNRRENKWIGKLSLPWRYVADRQRGATITLSPSIRLHTGAFGGGNIQVHWPL